MPLDPQIASLLQTYSATSRIPEDAEGLSRLTAPALRAEMARLAPAPPAPKGTSDMLVPHAAGHAIPVRIHAPRGGRNNSPIILYLHGGGWATGGNDSHASTANQLAADTGFLVAAVDYRLAPEHRFPAGLEDCWAALNWIAAHAGEIGADPGRIALVGDSAGANLAAVVTAMARDAGGPGIAYQVLIYPNTDTDLARWPSMRENGRGYMLTADMISWYHDQYFDPADRDDPRIAPIRASDLGRLPPALVITAEYDILRDEGEAYAERLRAAGVDVTMTRYAGQVHGFFRLPDSFHAARRVRSQVAEALRKALA